VIKFHFSFFSSIDPPFDPIQQNGLSLLCAGYGVGWFLCAWVWMTGRNVRVWMTGKKWNGY